MNEFTAVTETEEWEILTALSHDYREAIRKQYPNVHGTGLGLREVDSSFIAEPVLQVYVTEKRPENDLDDDEIVPHEITVTDAALADDADATIQSEGESGGEDADTAEITLITDVQETGLITPDVARESGPGDDENRDPREESLDTPHTTFNGYGGKLRRDSHEVYHAGVSIAHASVTAGSGSALQTDADGDDVILTNRHIASGSTTNTSGDPMLHPGNMDADDNQREIGTIKEVGPWNLSGTNYTDSAIVEVGGEVTAGRMSSRLLGAGHQQGIISPVVGEQYTNFGRTTGLTSSILVAVDATSTISYKWGSVYYEDLLHFTRFTDGGDSGSVTGKVAPETADVNPIGLHFAGSSTRSLACKLSRVQSVHGPLSPRTLDRDVSRAYVAPFMEEPPYFELTPFENESTDYGTLRALVANTGGERGTQTLRARSAGIDLDTQTVTLSPAESEIVEFDILDPSLSTGVSRSHSLYTDDVDEAVQLSVTTPTRHPIVSRAVDRAGNPLSGVEVRVTPAAGGAAVDEYTDADGYATIPVADGSYTIDFVHDRYEGASTTATVSGERVSTSATLQPVGYATGEDHHLRLRVLDPRGTPVEGVSATIKNNVGDTIRTATTDEEGYLIAWLDAIDGPFGITLRKTRYSSKALTYDPEAEGDTYHTETLLKPTTYNYVRVGVRNKNNYPVEGVTVGLHTGSDNPIYAGTTGRDGVAELATPDGTFVMSIDGEGYQQTWFHSQPGTVTNDTYISPFSPIADPGWYDLVRRVVDRRSGLGILGATVTTSGDSGGSKTTRADASGRAYQWRPTGAYTVTADAGAGYSTSTGSVDLTAANVRTIPLTPVGANEYSLAITVTDRYGNPIEGATVTAEGVEATDRVTGTTNASGYISFTNLIEGDYAVTAEATGFNPMTRTVELLENATSQLILYDEDGAVVSGMTNSNGQISVTLRGGNYTVEGSKPGHTTSSTQFVISGGTVTPSAPYVTMQRDEATTPVYNPSLRRITWSRQNEWLGATPKTGDTTRRGIIARADDGHRSDRHSLRLGTDLVGISSGAGSAYWPLDEVSGATVSDTIGEHHGSVAGAELGKEAALGGTAAYFDGQTDAITVPVEANSDLAFGGSFTIHALVKKISEQNNQTVIRNGFSAPGTTFLELREGARISAGFYDQGGTVRYSDQFHPGAAVQDEWHHIIVTHRPGANELVVYLNGAREQLTITATRPVPPVGGGNETAIGIGRRISGSDRPFHGYIGQVGFQNDGITQTQAVREYAMLNEPRITLPARTT